MNICGVFANCLINCPNTQQRMAGPSMSRRCRKFLKKIQRAKAKYDLQTIASSIQSELDRRNISYDEALTLGNFIQNRADQLPGNSIVYAVSDRDAYRRTLEIYLRDALLTRTEQLLLWEERRRLGISDEEHELLLAQLLEIWKSQGKSVTIQRFEKAGGSSNA
jgi:hypothetical protein